MKSVLVGLLIFGAQICQACSCGETDPVDVAYQRAGAVVLGRVIGLQIEAKEKDSSYEHVICTLEVFEVFKGNERIRTQAERRVVDVRTGSGGGDCGIPFLLGEIWLVYASGDEVLWTSICTRTSSRLDDMDALDELARKAGLNPEPNSRSQTGAHLVLPHPERKEESTLH